MQHVPKQELYTVFAFYIDIHSTHKQKPDKETLTVYQINFSTKQK